jgi:hypothetical protein
MFGLQDMRCIHTLTFCRHLSAIIAKYLDKLDKNEQGIPQIFLESKIIAPILPRILKHKINLKCYRYLKHYTLYTGCIRIRPTNFQDRFYGQK